MIVNNSLDEVKKRENALSIIKNIIETKGRNELYDLTGLSGGFIASSSQLSLLETYVGPAIFEDEIQEVGKKHLGGEKILPLNRTSSGILATILSLVDEGSNVVHYLAQLPAHPSIPRSCELVKANYFETDDFDKFEIPENTSLVVVTGSTMDHKVIDEDIFKKVIEMAHEQNIPVMVDDASGARLRTVVFNQKKACDLGADITITSQQEIPIIPAFTVFYLKNNIFIPIQKEEDMDTKLVYNYASFRTEDNVRLKIFMEVPDSIINQYPVYIMATRTNVYELNLIYGRLDPHWYAFNINTEFEHTPNLQIAYKMN
jgi:hypothetical protein